MQEPLIVNGKIQGRCPVDSHPLPMVKASTRPEIRQIVLQARAVQPSWEKLGFDKRAHLMKLAGKSMLRHRQEVLELLHDETGKTPADMLLSEAVGSLQYIQDWIRVARPQLKRRKLPISPLAFPGKRGVIEMIPRGIIAVIAPWNFPLGNFFKPIFPALLCGNSVIIKPSEYTPRTAEWFVKIMNQFLPSGVLNLIQGDKEAGQELIKSGVDAVTFTGSYQSGKEVAKLAADQMIPCSVELGGKDAAIVLSDCDFDRTVAGVLHWALQNTGQACGDIDRVYVEEGVAEQFIESLVGAVTRLRMVPGQPQNSDLGPVIHSHQLEILKDHVKDAIDLGAKLLCGGRTKGPGLWFEPTVLDHCNHSMKVMREPTFGPIIPIVRVKNIQEAVSCVNDCDYGLNASIWSRNINQAEEIARSLQVGTVFINNHAFTGAIPAAPWTGVKKTGYGVANSIFALNHYTRLRTIVTDRKKSPDAWWLPMDSVAEELGQNLAEAQLNKVSSILKLPFLIARRQRMILQFVRGKIGLKSEVKKKRVRLKDLLKNKRGQVGRRWVPPLTRREITWGQVAIETIFPQDPSLKLQPLPGECTREFLMDFYQSIPFPSNLGLRFMFWVAGFAPILKLKSWKTIEYISHEARFEVLNSFAQSESYFQRQFALIFKVYGSLSQLTTTRFHQALRADKVNAGVSEGRG